LLRKYSYFFVYNFELLLALSVPNGSRLFPSSRWWYTR
jgi:hypothetical protein